MHFLLPLMGRPSAMLHSNIREVFLFRKQPPVHTERGKDDEVQGKGNCPSPLSESSLECEEPQLTKALEPAQVA